MLWEVDIHPAPGQPDLAADQIAAEAAELGLGRRLAVRAARGDLIQGTLEQGQVEQLARELRADPVVERTVVARLGDRVLLDAPEGYERLIRSRCGKSGAMPTLVVGMYGNTGKQDMPTASVGMAPSGNHLPQRILIRHKRHNRQIRNLPQSSSGPS